MFWEKPGWEQEDKHLKALSNMPFQRPFPFFPNPNEDGLYIIRGPRQVGKTSWLKSILHHHINQNVKCYYHSCETTKDYRELRELLHSLKTYDAVLLDEVNFTSDWDRAVKQAIDAGETKTLIVTGSHSYDLIRGADRMPGRFGSGGEYTLLPMDFNEFSDARKQAGWSCQSRIDELEAYFRIGGFPSAIAEAKDTNRIPINSREMIWRWISGDVVRLGRNIESLIEIGIQVVKTLQTPVSFQTLAKKSHTPSHTTVQDYITLLESLFALRTLRFINPETESFHTKKNRKFYFTDPLLFHLFLDHAGEQFSKESFSLVAENVAHEHLARRMKRFGYHQNTGGEIDFIQPKKWAVEVKWSSGATNLSKNYLSRTLPWKTVWTKDNFLEMPDALTR